MLEVNLLKIKNNFSEEIIIETTKESQDGLDSKTNFIVTINSVEIILRKGYVCQLV